jgi:parallel beta-helix repeat protein
VAMLVAVVFLFAVPGGCAAEPQENPRDVAKAAAMKRCDRFASPRGRDHARGSWQRPFRTVRRLLRSLSPGDVGCLKRGIFEEDVAIRRAGSRGAPITLTRSPGARATIRGLISITRSSHDVLIDGLVLDGTNADEVPSPQINAERITFSRNRVTNHHSGICFILGGEGETYGIARDIQILDNRIYGCGRLPATNHDHGIYVEQSTGATVRGNLIHDNADWGVHFYPDARNTLMVENVLYRNGGGVIFAGEGDQASSGNLVTRNVIAGSVNTYNVESWWGDAVGDGNVATKNCLWDGAQGNVSEQVGFTASQNVVARPAFVDAARGDLRIRPGSRCARVVRESGQPRIVAGRH